MLQALKEYLQKQHYKVTAFGAGTAMVRMWEGELAVVQLCSGNALAMVSAPQMLKMRQDFLKGLNDGREVPVTVRFLTVVVVPAEVSEHFRELAEQVEGIWFVSEKERQIYVFERQSTQYFGLYEPMTEYLAQWDAGARKVATVTELRSNVQPVTLALVLLNIVVYIAVSCFGDVYSAEYMYSVGAITQNSIFVEHEFYRLLTSMFLHYGIEHLAGNMLSLLCLGSMLEKRIGHAWFAALYMLSGIFAGLASVCVDRYRSTVLLQAVNSVSAGASGAIFGAIGGLLAVVLVQRIGKKRVDGNLQISLRSLLWMIFFSLFQGFTTAGVDNWAHVGGLVFGFGFAFLLAIRRQLY